MLRSNSAPLFFCVQGSTLSYYIMRDEKKQSNIRPHHRGMGKTVGSRCLSRICVKRKNLKLISKSIKRIFLRIRHKTNPHPYGMRLDFERLSRGLTRALKNPDTPMGIWILWCERWDSNPHGVTTRTSNVLVYHSNTLANAFVLYPLFPDLSTDFFGDIPERKKEKYGEIYVFRLQTP